jgi:hypothetical protein
LDSVKVKFRYLEGHTTYPIVVTEDLQSMATIWYMSPKNNDCIRGWHDGWNQYYIIGIARYPDLGSDAALCPLNSDGTAVNNL